MLLQGVLGKMASGAGSAVAAGLAVGIAFVVMFSLASGPGFGGGVDDIESVLITMERTVCFGTCPAYSLEIYGNGTVVYEGYDFVAVEGRQTAQIPQESLRSLVGEFYRAGYFSLQDRYEQPVTDLPSTTTSITVDGKTKSVYRYGFGPEKLVLLEDMIDETAGTERWVGRSG